MGGYGTGPPSSWPWGRVALAALAAGLWLAAAAQAEERGSADNRSHLGSYHKIGRPPRSSYKPFQSYQDYRRNLGPHSGFHEGGGGYEGFRERAAELGPMSPNLLPGGPAPREEAEAQRRPELPQPGAAVPRESAAAALLFAPPSARRFDLEVPRYDYQRHRENRLGGTSRQSRARSVFAEIEGSSPGDDGAPLPDASRATSRPETPAGE